jgi:hypothetical protein
MAAPVVVRHDAARRARKVRAGMAGGIRIWAVAQA